jgi:hypothetical protein
MAPSACPEITAPLAGKDFAADQGGDPTSGQFLPDADSLFQLFAGLRADWRERSMMTPSPQSEDPAPAGTKQPRLGPSIWMWTAVIGGAGWGIGFFGPIVLTPTANLRSLIAFFSTGPLAAALGMQVGLVIAIRGIKRGQVKEATGWLILNWILLCAFYYFYLNWYAVGLECTVLLMLANIGLGMALLIYALLKLNIGLRALAIGFVLMLGAVAILIMSIFPPATQPLWGPLSERLIGNLPSFVFILDPRFDATRYWPALIVDADRWRLQFLATLLFVAVSCGLILRVDRR